MSSEGLLVVVYVGSSSCAPILMGLDGVKGGFTLGVWSA